MRARTSPASIAFIPARVGSSSLNSPIVVIMTIAVTRRWLTSTFGAAAILAAVALGCSEMEEVVESTPRTGEVDVIANVVGDWSGELHQKGLEPFEVRAQVHSPKDSRPSLVHYSGIDCSGDWTLIKVTGDTVQYRETIDRGEGGECKGTGTVELTPIDEKRLDYRFRGGGVESAGVLERAP